MVDNQDKSILYGRLVVYRTEDCHRLTKKASIIPAIDKGYCGRCQSKILMHWQLPGDEKYCWQCANMGRITTKHCLVTIEEPNDFETIVNPCTWQGKLTSLQQQVSDEQIKALKEGKSHLTYAVTSAGKTEMLFPMLTLAIKQKKRIAIVSPRIDVILELKIRIKAAFNVPFIVLFGGTEDEYQYTQLILATTHQLMKFKQAFDVIVLDEADAFPYANSQLLVTSVYQALKKNGIIFFLTATLNTTLKKMISRQEVLLSTLPLRFHGQPLPNLNVQRVNKWRKRLPIKVVRQMIHLKNKRIKFLVFVPQVKDIENVINQIKNEKYGLKILGTYAADATRLEKVQAMRDGLIDGLVTTTILERGVTFLGIDVLILGGDEPVFSTATLIQIAGRCGRSADRPNGLVRVYVQEKTKQVVNAIAEIHYLNNLGKHYEM
ncbi:DEAD/DEAH box helicase [Weissella thailandensis]|uniref:DEAD/DEAH box helicase n=1 Tax=Weissella thailandensis TaxID=89061 RepID=UPI0027E4F42E|nr:DEAD/DEAH box helicase [Weissella thailandensis]